jgi:pilus assembly protein CpaE
MTVVPELVCLRNTRLMLDQLHARGYGENKVRLILNRAGISGGVNQADIEERLHVRIHHTVPDDQPLVSLSINRGVPLILSHSRSAVARSIQSLAQRFVADTSSSATAAAATVTATATVNAKPPLRGGLFNRVFHRTTSVDA